MFFKRLLISTLVLGLPLIASGCAETTATASGDKLQAPSPQGPPIVGRGGMFQDANGCFVFEDRNGTLTPLIGSNGEPVCE